MSYIINPSWFYWIAVVDGLKGICIVGLVIGVVITIVTLIFSCSSLAEEDERELYRKVLKIAIPLLTVFVLGVVFIPSKTTMLEMQVARMATKENLGWTFEQIKAIVDYIVQAAKGL